MATPTPVVFIVGLCGPTQADYDKLMFKNKTWNITDYWGLRLPHGTPLLVTQWNMAGFDQPGKPIIPTTQHAIAIATQIRAKFGDARVNIVGHSLGGYLALATASVLAPMMPVVTTLDPVNRDRNTQAPDTTGLSAPPNVAQVFNYYRKVGSPLPWSTFVAHVATPIVNGVNLISAMVNNTIYIPKSADANDPHGAWNAHGEKVWDSAVIAQVAKG